MSGEGTSFPLNPVQFQVALSAMCIHFDTFVNLRVSVFHLRSEKSKLDTAAFDRFKSCEIVILSNTYMFPVNKCSCKRPPTQTARPAPYVHVPQIGCKVVGGWERQFIICQNLITYTFKTNSQEHWFSATALFNCQEENFALVLPTEMKVVAQWVKRLKQGCQETNRNTAICCERAKRGATAIPQTLPCQWCSTEMGSAVSCGTGRVSLARGLPSGLLGHTETHVARS